MQYISPIYFASFVLFSQFVLLNVVVAVLMKHLEESTSEDKKTVNNALEQSLRRSRLFSENYSQRFPDSFRASKNSTSLRGRRSERGIERKKPSVRFSGLRRTKSLDEIRNNNLSLDFNSDHDFDRFLNSIRIKRGTKSLRLRKPSIGDENILELPDSRKSNKNSSEILDIPDGEAAGTDGNISELSDNSDVPLRLFPKSSDSVISIEISEPHAITADSEC